MKQSKKNKALKKIVDMIENSMEERGFTEQEKNAAVERFCKHVDKVMARRGKVQMRKRKKEIA